MKTTSIAVPRLIRAVWLMSPFLLGACATNQDWDNPRFGESVRHTIALQTTDPNVGARGLDGEKAELVYRNYQTSVGSPKSVEGANVEF
jgi:hypothetical protein